MSVYVSPQHTGWEPYEKPIRCTDCLKLRWFTTFDGEKHAFCADDPDYIEIDPNLECEEH